MTVSMKKRIFIAMLALAAMVCFSAVLSLGARSAKAEDVMLCDMQEGEVVLSAPDWVNGENGHWFTKYHNETFNYNDNGTIKSDGKGIEFVPDPDDNGDRYMKIWTGKDGIYCFKATFNGSVNVADIAGLKIRTYYRVDLDNRSKVRIYSEASSSYDDEYAEIALDRQNEWNNVIISGESLNKISSNGVINGFTMWISIGSNGYPRDMRNFPDAENSGYILIDSVSAVTGFTTLTFTIDGATYQTRKVAEGAVTSEPECEFTVGKIMKWFTDPACTEVFTFGLPLAEDKTLYGKSVDYEMEDGYLFDGRNSSVKLEDPTLIQGDSSGWYNNGLEDERVTVDNGITLKTGTDAYYTFKMTFRKSIALELIDAVTFNMTINACAKNDSEMHFYAGNATSRYNSDKLIVMFSDYLSGYDGTVNVRFTREQMAKCAIDGELNSFNFAVHSKGYDGSVWCEPTLTINSVTFSYPVEISNYGAVSGTYYGNDGGVLVLRNNKLGTFNGSTITYVAYESGSFKVTCKGVTTEGMIDGDRYFYNGVKYYKYGGQVLDDLTIANFEPWDVTVSESTFVNSDNNGWVNSFYDLGNIPSFIERNGNYSLQLYNGTLNASQACKIAFGKVLPVNNIYSITLRMYLNLGETYSSAFMLYSANETRRNSTNKYEFAFSSVSETGYGWVEMVIDGEVLSMLADEDGNLSGLNIIFFCNDNLTMAVDGHVLLDSLTYEKACVLSFKEGENVTEVKVKENTCAEKPADPEKEGYYFAGWFEGDVPFDFSEPVTQDIELTARYYSLSDGSSLYGVYRSGSEYLSFNENNAVYHIAGETYEKHSYGLTENDILIIKTETGSSVQQKQSVISFNGKEYEKTESYSVVYSVEGVSETVRQERSGKVLQLAIPEKDGYESDGWYENGVKYNFTGTLNGDITLVAKYVFNETDDYSGYYNSYYNATHDILMIFGRNNDLTIVSANIERNVKYYVLSDGTWIVIDGTEKRVTDNISSVFYDGEMYKKLSSYEVIVDDGIKAITVTLDASSRYKLAKPNDPVKDGYSFIGWYIEGQRDEYDFNSVVYTNIKIVAKWKAETPEVKPAKKGCKGYLSATESVIFLLLAATMIAGKAFFAKKKEN